MSTTYANPKSITLIADPRVTKINVHENNCPYINLINQNELLFGPSPEIPNNTDYTILRKVVYDKICSAQKLLPNGLRFCLYEGYRGLELQKTLFDNRYNLTKKNHPEYTLVEIFTETTRLVSPIINLDGSINIPPHSTGGAFDIYLVDTNSNPIDMGIHPARWHQDLDGAISQTDSTSISKEAQNNRLIMNKALDSVGFVNYPTEFWHWSYGDKYWAYIKNQPFAIYNSRPVDLPK
ncbi:MAG: M15 family metallopeptidase [Legionellaceae bacterium]|nr:M15 family metallopeptidase [Legionellaceae bacterium]